MFKQIVVGVDGRAGGRDAVALAKVLVAAGGELTLAHVVPGDTYAYRGAGAADAAPEAERAEALLERRARRRVSKRRCAGAGLLQ